MGLQHQFVSAIPDGINPALIQPSKWNQDHIFNPPLTGVLCDPLGNNSFSAVTPSAAGQYLTYKRNVSTPTYAFVNPQIILAADCNWTIDPNVNITASIISTISMGYIPTGFVRDECINRYYIAIVDDDPAKTESCLVIGRDNTAKTLQIITSFSHTAGQYVMTSVSGGVQEAISVAEFLGGGTVLAPYGNTDTYGKTILWGSPAVHLRGHGPWGTNFVVKPNHVGTIFECTQTTHLLKLSDFLIGGHVNINSGAGIWLENSSSGYPLIENVIIYDHYAGVYVKGCDYLTVDKCKVVQLNNQNSKYGIAFVRGTGISPSCSSCTVTSSYFLSPHTNSGTSVSDTWHMDFGFYCEDADGILVENCHIRANFGVELLAGTGSSVGTVIFNNCIIDNCRARAIVISGSGTPTVFGQVFFNSCHIIANYEISAGEGTDLPGIHYDGTGSNGYVNFKGCTIAGFRSDGIYAINANNLLIEGCAVFDNNNGNVGGVGIKILGTSTDLRIVNNLIKDQRGGSAKQAYGVWLLGTVTRLDMSNNTFFGHTGDAYLSTAAITNSFVKNNIGIDTSSPILSAAASLDLTANLRRKFRLLTGTGVIDTITGAICHDDEIVFFCQTGITFSTAGNIANSVVTTTNQPVILRWESAASKWYAMKG